MDRSREALYAFLSVTLGFVEREAVLREWPAPGGVRATLLERGRLNATQAEALDRVVEAHLSRHGGNADEALTACASSDPLLRSRLAESSHRAVRTGDDTTRALPLASQLDRFALGAEIGRGGLGRVVAAWDSRLRRDVAIKLVIDGLPPALLRRFAREAEITGRLEHPNIIPVHDFGPQVGGGRLGLCMKRVQGRDLRKLLDDLLRGDEATRRKYTLQRLLRIFQDICLAVAFAHDRGVIHRDLKPSNVMIGDFGETLVVDWGLAKELGVDDPEPEGASPLVAPSPAAAGDATKLTAVPGKGGATVDGMLMGTPAYMAPEQAAGKHSEVDARSDIYALGAILYEILTFRPPVRGDSLDEIVTNVLEGRLVPPSERVSAGSALRPSDAGSFVPAELDAICLRAMAFRKEDRFPTALALHDEVQLFLEGVKQRERQAELAEACARRARAARERRESLAQEAAAAGAEAERRGKEVRPSDDKSAMWEAEDRAREARRRASQARAEEDRLVTEALGHDPGHAGARQMKSAMAWEAFEEAEKSGREAEAVLQRAVVEQFDDGTFRARLEGTGTLEVRAAAFGCECLRNGRLVPPQELEQSGYHRLSGRYVGGKPESEGMPSLEPAEPVRLRVHGPSCVATPVAARVWVWRFEERGRLLVPVTPAAHPAARDGGGPAPVDAVFAPDSPVRPLGPGVFLGQTPLAGVAMPMGSWLLVVEAEGMRPARVPVLVARCAAARQDVTLFAEADLDPGEIVVASGAFHFQGDAGNPYSMEAADPFVGDFAIARFPVTAAEYASFLNDLAERDPAAAAAAVPRATGGAAPYWPGPPFAVPTAAWLAGASPAQRSAAHRPGESVADWRDDWPVVGVSWRDAMRFAAWKRASTGAAWVLPTEEEWEKAARGVDSRAFVCGPYLDDRWACMNRSFPDGPRVSPVTAFPHDESPFGARGMAGNAMDHVLSVPGPGYQHWRAMRGGAWTHTAWRSRTTARLGDVPTHVARHLGFRLARLLQLGGASR